jgi:hypothetical protein
MWIILVIMGHMGHSEMTVEFLSILEQVWHLLRFEAEARDAQAAAEPRSLRR